MNPFSRTFVRMVGCVAVFLMMLVFAGLVLPATARAVLYVTSWLGFADVPYGMWALRWLIALYVLGFVSRRYRRWREGANERAYAKSRMGRTF